MEKYDVFSCLTRSVRPLTLYEIEEKLKELGKMYYKQNERETHIVVENTQVGHYNPRKENINIKLADNYKTTLCEAYDQFVGDERGKAQELLQPIITIMQLVYRREHSL